MRADKIVKWIESHFEGASSNRTMRRGQTKSIREGSGKECVVFGVRVLT